MEEPRGKSRAGAGALRRRKRFLEMGFEGRGRGSSVKRRQIRRVRTSGSGRSESGRDRAHPARRAHRPGPRGAELPKGPSEEEVGCAQGPGRGASGGSGPAVGRARRSPPPAFLWIRVDTRKHSLPSPTASLPSFGPAAALPACCNSGSPAFREGALLESHPQRNWDLGPALLTGGSQVLCSELVKHLKC
uniref:Uncharacterized protein n=1 Tax=Rangifer tarandus platyrhynchus TaxID=3082113 RepID=A0ACB0EFB4_RANTA|nr:unnamed protein product [Rangifer tarandus platyrhynchus]